MAEPAAVTALDWALFAWLLMLLGGMVLMAAFALGACVVLLAFAAMNTTLALWQRLK